MAGRLAFQPQFAPGTAPIVNLPGFQGFFPLFKINIGKH
jgi:hypothetical protein